MYIPENILNTLTEEQKKKVESLRTPEELLAYAKETGYELSAEQMDNVAGGSCNKFKELWVCSRNRVSCDPFY